MGMVSAGGGRKPVTTAGRQAKAVADSGYGLGSLARAGSERNRLKQLGEAPPSLGEQVARTIEAAPSGFLHLAEGVATDPVAGAATGAAIGSAIPGAGTVAGGIVGGVIGTAGWGLKSLIEGEPANPLETTGQFAESLGRTGYRLTHPQEYAKAVKRGEIVNSIVEDLANIGMVTGGAAKALDVGVGGTASKVVQAERALAEAQGAVESTGARVATAAREAATPGISPAIKAAKMNDLAGALETQGVARQMADAAAEVLAAERGKIGSGTLTAYKGLKGAASLGNRGANLPAEVWTKGAELLGRGLGKAAPKIAQVIAGDGTGAGAALIERLGQAKAWAESKLEARRPVRQVGEMIHQGEMQARVETEPILMLGAKFDKLLPEPAEREAALALTLEIPRLIADVAQQHGPDIVEPLVQAVTADGSYFGISEDGLALAVQFEQSRLPGDTAERIAQGVQYQREMMAPIQQGHLEGRGLAPEELVGERGEKVRRRARWQDTGQHANPEAIARVHRLRAQLMEKAEAAVEKRQGAVERASGRRNFTDEQVRAQTRSNKMDLDSAMSVAQALTEWHPDIAEASFPGITDPLELQRAIADAVLGAKAAGRLESLSPVVQELVNAAEWSGPKPMLAGLKGTGQLIGQGRREGAAAMGERIAGRMRDRAAAARARGETAQAAALDLLANLPTNRLKRVERAAARLEKAQAKLEAAQAAVESRAERVAGKGASAEANRAAFDAAAKEVETARRALRAQVKLEAARARDDLMEALGDTLPPHAGGWGGEWSRFEQALSKDGKAWLRNRNKELGLGADMRRGNRAERAQSAGGMDEMLERYAERRGIESGGSGMASADAAEALANEINAIAELERALREPLIARGAHPDLLDRLGHTDELEQYRPVDRGELNTPEEQAAVDAFNAEHGTGARDGTLGSPSGAREGLSARAAVALDGANALIENVGPEKATKWAERVTGGKMTAAEGAEAEFVAQAITQALDSGKKLPASVREALPQGAPEQWPTLEHVKAADEAMARADVEAQNQNANVTARSEDPNVQPLVREQVAEQAVRARGIEQDQARQAVAGDLVGQGMRAGERVGKAAGQAAEAERAAQAAGRAGDTAWRAAEAGHQRRVVGGVGTLTGRHGSRMFAEGKLTERERVAIRDLGIAERTLARVDEITQRRVMEAHTSLRNAPARYRPFLVAAKKMSDALEAKAAEVEAISPEAAALFREIQTDIPITLAHAVDAHYAPVYSIGGELPEHVGTGGGTSGVLPHTRRTSDYYERQVMKGPSSGSETAQLAARRVAGWVRNETAHRIQARFGVAPAMILAQDPVEAGLDPSLLDRVRYAVDEDTRAEAMLDFREAAKGRGLMVLENDSGGIAVMDAKLRSGQPLIDAMQKAGYVQWDPGSVFGRKPTKGVNTASVFIPEAVWDAFYKQLGPAGKAERAFRKFYDKPMRYWKDSVLALSPRWNVNNIIGGVVTATAGGGVNPGTYVKNFSRATEILRTVGDDERLAALLEKDPEAGAIAQRIDPRMHQGSEAPAMREGDYLSLDPESMSPYELRRTKLGRGYRATTQALYGWNGFIDDANRLAVFLSRRESLTPAQLAEHLRRDPELGRVAKGDVNALRDEIAVRESLKVVGDFTRLTPFERQVVRRILPFYPWMRHITKLALRMPVTAPMRVAWLMHLSAMFGEAPEFGFLQSYVPVGEEGDDGTRSFLRIGRVNPFGDAMYGGAGSSDYSVNNIPANIAGNLTPAISTPLGLLTGLDLRKWQQMTRPPGSGNFDSYGNESFTPLLGKGSFGVGEALSYLGNLSPQYRVAAAAKDGLDSLLGIHDWGGNLPLRYGNGQVMRSQGQDIMSDRPWYGPSLDLLGLPLGGPERIDLTGLRGKRDERARRAAAARARYSGGSSGTTTSGVLPAWGPSK